MGYQIIWFTFLTENNSYCLLLFLQDIVFSSTLIYYKIGNLMFCLTLAVLFGIPQLSIIFSYSCYSNELIIII